jgi:hypothetical protein
MKFPMIVVASLLCLSGCGGGGADKPQPGPADRAASAPLSAGSHDESRLPPTDQTQVNFPPSAAAESPVFGGGGMGAGSLAKYGLITADEHYIAERKAEAESRKRERGMPNDPRSMSVYISKLFISSPFVLEDPLVRDYLDQDGHLPLETLLKMEKIGNEFHPLLKSIMLKRSYLETKRLTRLTQYSLESDSVLFRDLTSLVRLAMRVQQIPAPGGTTSFDAPGFVKDLLRPGTAEAVRAASEVARKVSAAIPERQPWGQDDGERASRGLVNLAAAVRAMSEYPKDERSRLRKIPPISGPFHMPGNVKSFSIFIPNSEWPGIERWLEDHLTKAKMSRDSLPEPEARKQVRTDIGELEKFGFNVRCYLYIEPEGGP